MQYDFVSTREQLREYYYFVNYYKKERASNNAMPLRVNFTHAATRCNYQNL